MSNSDQSTNWVTIGIPQEKRDRAREEFEETYGEILEAGMKALDGEPVGEFDPEDMTFEQVATANQVESLREVLDNLDDSVDIDELEDRIVTRLARETQADLQSFEQELEEIANSASMASEPTFGDEQVKQIMNRIDDLQSQLPKDVAKEVQR